MLIKQGSTFFLKIVICLVGIGALAVCILLLPQGIISELQGDFDYGAIFAGLYAPAIPFFIALYQALKLLSYIDKNQAFSDMSVQALKNIKYCALTISGLFAAGMPYIFYVADRDDAPGVALIGFIIIGASLVIAVFAAVLQRLLRDALAIKSENDLTV